MSDKISKYMQAANAERRYHYAYIESDEYFPNVYTVAMLEYTQSWRTEDNVSSG